MKIKQNSFAKQLFTILVFTFTLFFGLKPFNFVSGNDIHFKKESGGIQFNSSSFSGESHYRSIAFTREFIDFTPYSHLSLYLELKPDRKPINLGIIAEINDGQLQPVLIIAQWQNSLIIRSRRSNDFIEDSYEEHGVRDCFANGETSSVLVAYRPGETNIYLNGKLVSQKKGFDLIERNVSTKGRIILGSSGVGGGLWIGTMSHFALFKKYIVSEDISNFTPFIEYDFRNFKDQYVSNLQAESFNLQVPHYYKSTIVKRFARLSTWKKHKAGATNDVVINIVGFLPLGFVTYLLLCQRIRSRVVLFVITCTVAFLFSLAIESLQMFLPSRHPSHVDLLCNSFGGFIAAFAAHFLIRIRV